MKATITLKVELDPGIRPGTKWNRLERVTRLVAGYAGKLRHVKGISSATAQIDVAEGDGASGRISVVVDEPPDMI